MKWLLAIPQLIIVGCALGGSGVGASGWSEILTLVASVSTLFRQGRYPAELQPDRRARALVCRVVA